MLWWCYATWTHIGTHPRCGRERQEFWVPSGNLMAALVSGQMSTFVEPLKVSWVLRHIRIYTSKLGRETSWWLVSIGKCTIASCWKHWQSTPSAWLGLLLELHGRRGERRGWGWAAVQVIPLQPWKEMNGQSGTAFEGPNMYVVLGLGIECTWFILFESYEVIVLT